VSRVVDPWNREYEAQGIPSSFREEPSGALEWLWTSLPWLRPELEVQCALDVGCGTGRNSFFLAEKGVRVTGFDRSTVAIEKARAAVRNRPTLVESVEFEVHDLSLGLPAGDRSVDLVIDTFVFFHQTTVDLRRRYGREVARVLRPGGALLLSLAGADDGYYRACPLVPAKSTEAVRVVRDPVAEVENILIRPSALERELEPLELELLWRKRKLGRMHGSQYLRETMVTVWSHGDSTDPPLVI
jgi:SAM-dependent methyltransferase